MAIIKTYTLDDVYETAILLYVSEFTDAYFKKTAEGLDGLGLDGESFLKKHMAPVERYIATFRRYRNVSDDFAKVFLKENSMEFYFFCVGLVAGHRQWLEHPQQVEESSIIAAAFSDLAEFCGRDPGEEFSEEAYFSLLDEADLPDEMKWRLMALRRHAKEWFLLLATAIADHRVGFEEAAAAVEKSLDKLLKRYEEESPHRVEQLCEDLSDQDVAMIPSLAVPFTVFIEPEKRYCYCGLLSYLVPTPRQAENLSDSALILGLKALSDPGRLEIMRSLGYASKYNLEIAKEMGLTAATMSHHMSLLLSCGFVSVSKGGGRVYYSLDREAVERFLGSLRHKILGIK